MKGLKMKQKLKILLKKLKGLLPSKLPIGATELDKFTTDIFETYGIPNLPTYKQAVCKMILHLGPQENRKSKSWFARSIAKAQANETAYAILEEQVREDARRQREEKQAAETARLQANETAYTILEEQVRENARLQAIEVNSNGASNAKVQA
jgi:hypothetical protein